MTQQFEIIAKTFMGLEPVLAKELTQLGANDVQIGRRMVSFKGDKELLYRANFQLHTAIRILKPIKHFKALSADDVYEGVKDIDWGEYIGIDKTFAVDSVVFSEEFRHSKFVAYKVKDAIVDQFREKTGQRPNISISILISVCTSTLPKTNVHCVLTLVATRCIVAAIVRSLSRHHSMKCWLQV